MVLFKADKYCLGVFIFPGVAGLDVVSRSTANVVLLVVVGNDGGVFVFDGGVCVDVFVTVGVLAIIVAVVGVVVVVVIAVDTVIVVVFVVRNRDYNVFGVIAVVFIVFVLLLMSLWSLLLFLVLMKRVVLLDWPRLSRPN